MKENNNNKHKGYEKPSVSVDQGNIEIDEAYSAAAVPAAAPAISPAATAGAIVAAAALTKWC